MIQPKTLVQIKFLNIWGFIVLFLSPGFNAYAQADKIAARAFENRIKLYDLSIKEAEMKIEANNLWIEASSDNKEIENLEKNNKEQRKIISNVKKIQKQVEESYNKSTGSSTKLSKREADVFKLLGAANGKNATDSQKFIDIYSEKVLQAIQNASKQGEDKEKWIKAMNKWEDVIIIIKKIEEMSHESMIYFYVAAEILDPGIVVGGNEEDKQRMEKLKKDTIQKIYEEDGLF